MSELRTGLIGAHISRTRMPAALAILCDLAGWTLTFDRIDTALIDGFDFEARVDQARSDGWTGMIVTHPYKTRARAYAGAHMHPDVAHLGASNSLVFGPRLTGFNTDYTGFLAAFGAAVPGPVGNVLMIGAGGVAHALGPAIAGLSGPDDRLMIHDLDLDRAGALAREIGPKAVVSTRAELPGAIRSADGLVNATPMGMAEYPGSAFDLDRIGNHQRWAFDAVYTPVWTPFLSAARAAGLECITGFDLFRHMAVRTFAALTGTAPEPADILPRLAALEPKGEVDAE